MITRLMRMFANRRIFAAASFLAAVAAHHAAFGISERPNFVIIFCDNLGYGDIEPFGSTVHRTPRLLRMAREGRRFTHFYVSAGVCTPSRASLLTGCYAQRIGMHVNPRDGHVLRPVSPYGLNPDEITLPEILREHGYATGIFGKWHLGDQPEFLPCRHGFDTFFGLPYSDDMTQDVGRHLAPKYDGHLWPPLPLLKNDDVVEAPVDRNLLTKRCTEQVLTFIDRHADQPFFVYFAQPMPGSTQAPFSSARFRGHSRNGPWGDAVEEIDWSTGQILDRLRQHDIHEETLVIWLSDNGAPTSGRPDDLSRGSNRPLHGRGYTTAEGAFRTPTLMWWPGVVPPGTECTELATTLDLFPTLARLAGIPFGHPVDGHDIGPLIRAEPGARTPYEAFFYYDQDQLQAVRSGPWKLFVPLEDFSRHPHFTSRPATEPLLFHLRNDVSCRRNVAAEHPDVVRRLSRLADAARRDLGDRGRPGTGQRPAGHLTARPARPLVRPDESGGRVSS